MMQSNDTPTLSKVATWTTTTMASSTVNIPKTLKLYYADFPFWRGECTRMILFIGNVPFDDVRMSRDEIKAMKEEGKITFGTMPVLEIDNGQILSQTQAIASYCAKLAGLHPNDIWQQAKVDECLDGCTDITEVIVATMKISNMDEKIKKRQELCNKEDGGGRLYMYLNGLNQICTQNNDGSGYSVGKSLTIADLAIWRVVMWIDGGSIDGLPDKFVQNNFPALHKVFAAVDAMPKVQEWKTKHAKFYDKK